MAVMKEDLLIIGAGGHAIVLVDIANKMERFNSIGLIDNQVLKGNVVCGVPVVGSDSDLGSMLDENPATRVSAKEALYHPY